MPETRKTQARAFDRLLTEACDFEEGSRARLALKRLKITTAEFLCEFDVEHLRGNLMAPDFDDDDNEIPDTLVAIPRYEINRLLFLRQWLNEKR